MHIYICMMHMHFIKKATVNGKRLLCGIFSRSRYHRVFTGGVYEVTCKHESQ